MWVEFSTSAPPASVIRLPGACRIICPAMTPVVIDRSQHTISRGKISPEALKVLNRLHEVGFLAYLAGGGVRDLLLGRQPKDFDIATDAHPNQVKRLFRDCRLVGRRFRLAHVFFRNTYIEVATFRAHMPPDAQPVPEHLFQKRDGVIASSSSGRLKSLMSTSSNNGKSCPR